MQCTHGNFPFCQALVGTLCIGNYFVPNTYYVITYILCPTGMQHKHGECQKKKGGVGGEMQKN